MLICLKPFATEEDTRTSTIAPDSPVLARRGSRAPFATTEDKADDAGQVALKQAESVLMNMQLRLMTVCNIRIIS